MKAIGLEALTGNQSRTYIKRQVSQDQVDRPIHLAIAVWEEPWASAPHGEITGWVIVLDSTDSGQQEVLKGTTTAADPNDEIMADLKKLLAPIEDPLHNSWVVVGRRRNQLRGVLEAAGFDVTGSFSEKNRAHRRAAALRKSTKKAWGKKARAAGEVPEEKPRAPIETTETLWLPRYQRRQASGGTVVASCDASSDTQTKGTMCFVAASGDYLVKAVRTTASTDELELEAMTLALRYAVNIAATEIYIESDSAAALEAVKYIIRGGQSRRPWRGIHHRARQRFYQAWRAAMDLSGGQVTISRVLGHAGDPLNKAADHLAYIALRATAHPRKQAAPTLAKAIKKEIAAAQAALAQS